VCAIYRFATLVSRSEMAINRLGARIIDQAALDLLAMEQPMAIDLRFILAVIKINADLERGGRFRQEASAIGVRTMEVHGCRRPAGGYPAHGLAGLPTMVPPLATVLHRG